MWDYDTNSPKCGEQPFPFLDLSVFLGYRDFGSWAHTASVSDGLSQRMGLSSHRSNSPNPSGLLRIEASLRLPCISYIYKAPYFHFHIFNKKSIVRAKPSTLSEHSVVEVNLQIITTVTPNSPSVEMSSASSNQSVVRDGAEYENVYPSGHKDQESPGEDRSPSASSSSSTDEDVEIVEIDGSGDDGNQALESVVGVDGLRKFIMLPEWTVHKFTSVIRDKHFNTFRINFQIPDYVSIRLPHVSEKCYYEGVEGVGIYEQALKAGLRFPLSTLHRELLHYLGLSVTQITDDVENCHQ
uniref:Uncharacterized protein n=1 Tax=Quercus lobata TaxID=97700 RepID=A0A7N2L4G0_QUELO